MSKIMRKKMQKRIFSFLELEAEKIEWEFLFRASQPNHKSRYAAPFSKLVTAI